MNTVQNVAMPVAPSVRVQHTRMGISSFVIGLFSIVLFIIMFVLAAGIGLEARHQGHQVDPTSADTIMLGLFIMFIGMIVLVGTGLGIAGTVQKQRKRLFGVIGLCLNGGIVLLIVLLMLIGLTVR